MWEEKSCSAVSYKMIVHNIIIDFDLHVTYNRKMKIIYAIAVILLK